METLESSQTTCLLTVWRRWAIAWSNADLSSVRSSDNYTREISQQIHQPSVTKFSFKFLVEN